MTPAISWTSILRRAHLRGAVEMWVASARFKALLGAVSLAASSVILLAFGSPSFAQTFFPGTNFTAVWTSNPYSTNYDGATFTQRITRWPLSRPDGMPDNDHADRVTPLSGTQLAGHDHIHTSGNSRVQDRLVVGIGDGGSTRPDRDQPRHAHAAEGLRRV